MGKIVGLAGVDSFAYFVDVETGQYHSLTAKKPGKVLAWVVGLCGPSSGYLLYLVTRRQAEAFNRWYFSVATPGLNAWVLLVTVVSAAVAGYGAGWLVLLRLRKRYVPVVLEQGLEVTVVRQARKELDKVLRIIFICFFVALFVGLLFYWTSYFPSVLVIWLCLWLVFFVLFGGFVARFKVVWGRWWELKREGLV